MDNIKVPSLEGLKEVARWGVLFAISWFITETLKQLNVVPEFYNLKFWEFSYLLPLRYSLQLGLTFAGRFVDKYLFEKTKQDNSTETKGLLWF